MSVKGIIRFAIGFCIALGIFVFVTPFIHVPRSQLFPPIFTYPGTKGRTNGVITHRRDLPTSAWFSQGEHDYFVDYSFNVKAPLILGGPPVGKVTKYTGTVLVTGDTLDKLKTGQTIPVRYDPEYPDLNGVDAPWGGRSGIGASRMFSGWIFWFIGMLVLGYCISPLIERVALRESY